VQNEFLSPWGVCKVFSSVSWGKEIRSNYTNKASNKVHRPHLYQSQKCSIEYENNIKNDAYLINACGVSKILPLIKNSKSQSSNCKGSRTREIYRYNTETLTNSIECNHHPEKHADLFDHVRIGHLDFELNTVQKQKVVLGSWAISTPYPLVLFHPQMQKGKLTIIPKEIHHL